MQSTRDISRDATQQWMVRLENGKTIGALDVQWEFHDLAQKHLRNTSAETDWLLESWGFVLEAIASNHQSLIGGVDWITKKWLLEAFVESEGLSWDDPWLQSVDLEYHNIDPAQRFVLCCHSWQTNCGMEQQRPPFQCDACSAGEYTGVRSCSGSGFFSGV